jgi:hypothetical protein
MVVSYAVPASPGEKRRPAVVTAAGYLLFLVAVILIINALLPLSSLSKVLDATREAYANSTNPTPDTVVSITRIASIVGVVIGILFAALFAVLGTLDLRGSRAARIVTWVFAGLGVLCTGCGLGGTGLSGRFTTGTANGVDVKAATDHINAARPSWLTPTVAALSAIALIALILVIILLALPAANAYFRKEQPAFIPPDAGFPNPPYPPGPTAQGGSQPPPSA